MNTGYAIVKCSLLIFAGQCLSVFTVDTHFKRKALKQSTTSSCFKIFDCQVPGFLNNRARASSLQYAEAILGFQVTSEKPKAKLKLKILNFYLYRVESAYNA